MSKRIKIANKWVGEDRPVFIIAEAGINHNGSLKLAKKLVKAAKWAGADAVKFQTFKTEELVTKYARCAGYQSRGAGKNNFQYKTLKKLELSKSAYRSLKVYSKKLGLIFLSTPFDNASVDFLQKLGVPAFKVGSGDITNLPLLSHIAKKSKPIILSTGMSSLKEIRDAIKVIYFEGNKNLILLQCTSSYPLDISQVNLRVISRLKKQFSVPVGFSDHTLSTAIPAAAVALGACIIEKHFTLSRQLAGWDHKASLEPKEFKAMVRNIREVEKALGSLAKVVTSAERAIREVARRSIVAKTDIAKGTRITKRMLAIKRPGIGLKPSKLDLILGKIAKVTIKKDWLIKQSQLKRR